MTTFAISDLGADQINWHGALGFDQRPNGISPRRLPDWTRPQLPEGVDMMSRMPSGVRLQFETDSASVGITALCTTMHWPGREQRATVFDLEIDDKILSRSTEDGNVIEIDMRNPADYRIVRGSPATLTFEDLPAGHKFCELWLPQNAYVEIQSLHIDDGCYITAPTGDNRKRWIHYGSSISHCMEAARPSHIWPAVAARNAGVSLQNLGVGGQCHLDLFVARTIRDSDADIISIKTGINIINMDSMRERIFAPLLHGFLDTIREAKPDTPIVMISPIYCPSAEHNPGPTIPTADGKFDTIDRPEALGMGAMSLTRVRELITDVVNIRKETGDDNLHYLSGLELFGEADAHDLPDDLHPNPAGYIRMGERFATKTLNDLAWRS